jgi:hypothetical protein
MTPLGCFAMWVLVSVLSGPLIGRWLMGAR